MDMRPGSDLVQGPPSRLPRAAALDSHARKPGPPLLEGTQAPWTPACRGVRPASQPRSRRQLSAYDFGHAAIRNPARHALRAKLLAGVVRPHHGRRSDRPMA
jgi:hypothetical protein